MYEEPFIRRVFSRSRNRKEESFQHSVRNRDYKCVILGIPVLPGAGWEGFEVAHIFPLGRQSLWNQCNFDSVITESAERPINSVQNGILISAHMHQLFDSYVISINPDVSQILHTIMGSGMRLTSSYNLGWLQNYKLQKR